MIENPWLETFQALADRLNEWRRACEAEDEEPVELVFDAHDQATVRSAS